MQELYIKHTSRLHDLVQCCEWCQHVFRNFDVHFLYPRRFVFTHIRCLRLKAKAVAENMPLPCPDAVRRSFLGLGAWWRLVGFYFLGNQWKLGDHVGDGWIWDEFCAVVLLWLVKGTHPKSYKMQGMCINVQANHRVHINFLRVIWYTLIYIHTAM